MIMIMVMSIIIITHVNVIIVIGRLGAGHRIVQIGILHLGAYLDRLLTFPGAPDRVYSQSPYGFKILDFRWFGPSRI